MKVFPILDDFSITDRPYCVFSDGDPAVLSFFDEHGDKLPEIRVSNDPEMDNAYILLDSCISGGSYREFLQNAIKQWKGMVCLYLQRSCVRFALPCFDGIGTEAETITEDHAAYCESLCANLCFSADGRTATLYDDDFTLRKKYQVAVEMDVPMLVAEKDILDKIKAP